MLLVKIKYTCTYPIFGVIGKISVSFSNLCFSNSPFSWRTHIYEFSEKIISKLRGKMLKLRDNVRLIYQIYMNSEQQTDSFNHTYTCKCGFTLLSIFRVSARRGLVKILQTNKNGDPPPLLFKFHMER